MDTSRPAPAPAPHPPLPLSIHSYKIREANEADLNNLTRMHISGFIAEPYDNFCYPLRVRYQDDHFTWLRKEYAYYLNNPHKYLVHTVEANRKSSEDEACILVGLAVWNIDVLAQASVLDRGLDERKDVNKKHLQAYTDVVSKRYRPGGFFHQWGNSQITLSVLTVHPDHRRRGIGTTLVGWGMKAASAKQWPVTLCASPMGQLLYTHLGFEKIGTELIRTDAEAESFSSAVMILIPKAKD